MLCPRTLQSERETCLYISGIHSLPRAILEQILSGEEAEVAVERIHEYLTAIGQNVRNGTVSLDDFVIFKVGP